MPALKTGYEHRLAGIRILIVDDSYDYRLLLDRVLTRAGALVTQADSARDALQASGHAEFDIVLTDVQMPETDGFEFVSLLRGTGSVIPVIAVTASKGVIQVPPAQTSSIAAHFGKPTDSTKLIDAICGILSVKDL